MKLILASKSPRRRQILGEMGYTFEVLVAECDESYAHTLSPREGVELLAQRKGAAVADAYGLTQDVNSVILSSDTLVDLDGVALGKPVDEEDAFRMLRSLSGNTHSVFTGVAVLGSEGLDLRSEESRVTFREMSDEEIRGYIATGEPMDKAGAYGVQGRGAVFVEHLDGDFFNVMGLPLCTLAQMLKQQGVKVF